MTRGSISVGILALQGCIDPHIEMFSKVGATCIKVLSSDDLANIDRIVIPGGESTTMLRLLNTTGMYSDLLEFGKKRPVWGVCAGAILIAKEVIHPDQQSMKLIPMRATRNYYGSQTDSFKAKIDFKELDTSIEVDFIRAPLLEALSPEVKVHARHNGQPVMMQFGRVMATSFHTELGTNPRLHQYFLTV